MMDFLQHYGYAAVFLALLLENTIIVGVFFPGIGVLVAAGYFAGTSDLHLGLVLATAWLGVFTGDQVGFAIGYYGLDRVTFVHKLLERNAARAESLRNSRTPALLFFQFPMPLRIAVPLLAGAVRMPLRRWLIWNAAATTIFTVTVASIGYFTGRFAGGLESAQSWGVRVQYLFIFLFVLWVTSWIVKFVRKKRNRRTGPEV